MLPLIEQHRTEIEALCRKYGVKRLDLFGSAARGDFAVINGWRHDNIWSQGSRWSTPELMERATGQKLDAGYFIAHLRARYSA